MGQNDGVKKLRQMRKEIAQIKTVARERELGIHGEIEDVKEAAPVAETKARKVKQTAPVAEAEPVKAEEAAPVTETKIRKTKKAAPAAEKKTAKAKGARK